MANLFCLSLSPVLPFSYAVCTLPSTAMSMKNFESIPIYGKD